MRERIEWYGVVLSGGKFRFLTPVFFSIARLFKGQPLPIVSLDDWEF